MLVYQVHYETRGDRIHVRFQARYHGEVGNLQRKKTARGVKPPTQVQWNARRCRSIARVHCTYSIPAPADDSEQYQ